jgi:hypothetical protein
MTKAQQSERAEAIARLRETLKPGDTLYTVLRHVSRSGMYRAIDVYYLANGDTNKDGTLRPPVKMWLSRLIARATGIRFDENREAIGIGGCGMDMGFEIVYTLGRAMWPDGVESDYSGRKNNDGGYAFRQEWL